MRAKLVVTGITPISYNDTKQSETISMRAVSASIYPEDGSDENNTFAKWSPNADFAITIANPALWDKFSLGQEFYADFTEVAPRAEWPPARCVPFDTTSRDSMAESVRDLGLKHGSSGRLTIYLTEADAKNLMPFSSADLPAEESARAGYPPGARIIYPAKESLIALE